MANDLVSILVRVQPEWLDPVQRNICKAELSPPVRRAVLKVCYEDNEVPGILFLNGPQVSCVSVNAIMFGQKAVLPRHFQSHQPESHIQIPNQSRGDQYEEANPALIPLRFPERRSDYRFPEDCCREHGHKADLTQPRWAEVAADMVSQLETEARSHRARVIVYTLPVELFDATIEILVPGSRLQATNSPVAMVTVSKSGVVPIHPPQARVENMDGAVAPPSQLANLDLAAATRRLFMPA